jgi:tetratricopeptide (TPR) repeat protein
MPPIENTVFLSYRRTNASWALAVFQNLTQNGYDVFFDYNGIASGDFESVILENIRTRAHFIILLTPSALERCEQPDDWVRREIETAIRLRRNIVPLMLEGFEFTSAGIEKYLVGNLATLSKYNAIRIHVDYFAEAMERLRAKFLNVATEAVPHPASPTAQRSARAQQTAASGATAVEESKLTAEELFEKANQTSDLQEKVRLNTEAIRSMPGYAFAFHNRGSVRWQLHDYEGAWRDYTEAIRLNPELAATYLCRGNLLLECNDSDLAIKDYDEAIRLEPANSEAHCKRGEALAKNGDVEGAYRELTEAIRLDPSDSHAFHSRGNLLQEKKGNLQAALKDHDEAIRLEPKMCHLYNARALTRWALDDLSGADDDFSSAIRLKPDEAFLLDNRGNLRLHRKDYKGALRDFTEAIRLIPDQEVTAAFLRHRAEVRSLLGDRKGAKDDGREAESLESNKRT